MNKLGFFYGTLKSGYGNNAILSKSSTFVGTAKTKANFALVNAGFPYMTRSELISKGAIITAPVQGEVWQINDEETLQRLDWLEGNGSHYHRQSITVELNGEEIEVETYLQLDSKVTLSYPTCPTIDGVLTWGR